MGIASATRPIKSKNPISPHGLRKGETVIDQYPIPGKFRFKSTWLQGDELLVLMRQGFVLIVNVGIEVGR